MCHRKLTESGQKCQKAHLPVFFFQFEPNIEALCRCVASYLQKKQFEFIISAHARQEWDQIRSNIPKDTSSGQRFIWVEYRVTKTTATWDI